MELAQKAKVILRLRILSLFYIFTLVALDQMLKNSSLHANYGVINNCYILGKFCLSNVINFFLLLLLLVFLVNIIKLRGYVFALILISAGLASNLLDRIFRNGVVDYWKFGFFSNKLINFNLSDILIILGVLLYANRILRHK